MSASTIARRATVINPFAGAGRAIPRSALQAATNHLARNARNSGLRSPAVALLIPIRNFSTPETSGHGAGPHSGPPPGFNAEEAKKPIPKASSETTKVAAVKPKSTEVEAKQSPKNETELVAGASVTSVTETKQAAVEKKEDPKKEEKKKMTIMQRIKHEVMHYWDGTKLLATEVKISTRLALKMAAGYELTRREDKQLKRTVQDLGRLVPFSVFVIVPFAELLLPVALKLFPNMLPSTYETVKSKADKAARLRTTRKDVSKLLRSTLNETGLPLTQATVQREEIVQFFKKIRSGGEKPTAQDVIKVCKIFKDDMTLDNLSRPQLVSMCRYMNLTHVGHDSWLRFLIRRRMKQIKDDDRSIFHEGVESLSVGEVQTACAYRGIKTSDASPAKLRESLQAWLDLRLREGVPSTLLVLSNAYMYSQAREEGEEWTQIDALSAVLSSIPEELYHEVQLDVDSAEGVATNKQRLEVLKEQQELIEEELEQTKESLDTGFATPSDSENIDDKDEHHVLAGSDVLEKAQVSEAVEAEQDRIDAVRAAPAKEAELTKGEK
ncbi:LETM1-domain-containing protein [Thozetella sp. PMI_491]|nr:LETM1-domain-containing protein [Thozetella sp. PMI_491]